MSYVHVVDIRLRLIPTAVDAVRFAIRLFILISLLVRERESRQTVFGGIEGVTCIGGGKCRKRQVPAWPGRRGAWEDSTVAVHDDILI